MRILSTALAIVATAGCAHPTRPTPARRWDVVGTVLDLEGRPIHARLFVCISIKGGGGGGRRCSSVDSLGNFAIDSASGYELSVGVACELIRPPFSKSLAGGAPITTPGVARRDFRVNPVGCDSRPLRTIHGEFSGRWTTGFEANGFVPCQNSEWFVPSDFAAVDRLNHRAASVSMTSSAWRKLKFPQLPDDTSHVLHSDTYFVRWRGTIVGPGHESMYAFELTVDKVLEIRAPSPSDCS
jgi:hypothetical protein